MHRKVGTSKCVQKFRAYKNSRINWLEYILFLYSGALWRGEGRGGRRGGGNADRVISSDRLLKSSVVRGHDDNVWHYEVLLEFFCYNVWTVVTFFMPISPPLPPPIHLKFCSVALPHTVDVNE